MLDALNDDMAAVEFRCPAQVQPFGRHRLKPKALRVIVNQAKGFPVYDCRADQFELQPAEIRSFAKVAPVGPLAEGRCQAVALFGRYACRRRAQTGPDKIAKHVADSVANPRIVRRQVAGAPPHDIEGGAGFRVDRPERADSMAAP